MTEETLREQVTHAKQFELDQQTPFNSITETVDGNK